MKAPYTPAAGARTAASIVLLRDGDAGLEVLMLRRAERHGDIRSGAAVFPGGVLDAADRLAHPWVLGPSDELASQRLGLAEGGLDYWIAAVRECFEEVGLLLATGEAGQPIDLAARAADLHPWRARLNDRTATIDQFCRHFGLTLDLRGMVYSGHWLTPPGVPQRFDTRFFTAMAPPGQSAVADAGEAQELMWLAPKAALDPARELKLLPVTRRTLQELARFASAADAYGDALERREVRLMMPRLAKSAKGTTILLPEESAYAEVGRLDPEGRIDAWADIAPGRSVRLSERIRRVTAPNPGVMTGPGTNSYLVGSPGGEWAVIDPGPDDDQHLRALIAAAPGPVTRILVTHTHVDHSPGAAGLRRATGAPVLGRRALHAAGHDPQFAPSEELEHGQRITLGAGATLRVIHTPGHASNHLCYLLEEEKTLFTGDHVMQGSTVVINPPDGDMSEYLRTLRDLLDEDVEWLAPGHGFLVAQPHQVIRALIEHRLRREARVRDALGRHAPCAIDALLPDVYADVHSALYPVAARSLLAHLLKLRTDGEAGSDGERWWLRR
jgi:glyoxylase-like metal-dependent hydrolase (beta-lactamase superfamily II)/8-oxo-dGTP pyrophosphatase MutT (NUDIX family)